MKRSTKYVAFDVHQTTTVASVREESGRVIAERRARWVRSKTRTSTTLRCGTRSCTGASRMTSSAGRRNTDRSGLAGTSSRLAGKRRRRLLESGKSKGVRGRGLSCDAERFFRNPCCAFRGGRRITSGGVSVALLGGRRQVPRHTTQRLPYQNGRADSFVGLLASVGAGPESSFCPPKSHDQPGS